VLNARRARLARADTDDVTNAVVAALLALDQEDLAARAGQTRYGYVEPTEAARRLGLGSLQALQSVDRHIRHDDLVVSWAPDFPGETADRDRRR
jgi:hypothetical protein